MSASPNPHFSPFAAEILDGLSANPKRIAHRYLFDEVGIGLFESLSLLPEHGIDRAEERLLRRHARELPELVFEPSLLAELAGVRKRSSEYVVRSFAGSSSIANDLTPTFGVSFDSHEWLARAAKVTANRVKGKPVLLMLLGDTSGMLDRASFFRFLEDLRALLTRGDCLLFGTDLCKGADKMLAAYRDQAGIVSAFNKNLLGRINRELAGRFDATMFGHAVSWNSLGRSIELHLRSQVEQDVYIGALGKRFHFSEGDSIRTLCDYKYSELELAQFSEKTGFKSVKTWVDIEWSYAETLLTV